MTRKIHLNPEMIKDRKSTAKYMSALFQFPDGFVQNLSTLKDCLEEVYTDTDILLSKQCVKESCQNSYAFKVLLAIGKAADVNPYLHIHFTE